MTAGTPARPPCQLCGELRTVTDLVLDVVSKEQLESVHHASDQTVTKASMLSVELECRLLSS